MGHKTCRQYEAHDNADVIAELLKRGVAFIIKRNLRKEPIEQWLSFARRVGNCLVAREGESVYIGEASHYRVAEREDFTPIFAIFEVIERTIDKDGQQLLIPGGLG